MLNWKPPWQGAAKDFVDVACGTPEDIGQSNSVGNQTTAFSKISEWINRGQRMSCRERGDQVAVIGHEDIGHNNEGTVRTTGQRRDCVFDLSRVTNRRM